MDLSEGGNRVWRWTHFYKSTSTTQKSKNEMIQRCSLSLHSKGLRLGDYGSLYIYQYMIEVKVSITRRLLNKRIPTLWSIKIKMCRCLSGHTLPLVINTILLSIDQYYILCGEFYSTDRTIEMHLFCTWEIIFFFSF